MSTTKRKKRKKKSRARMPLTVAQRRVLNMLKKTGGIAYAYLRGKGVKCYRIRDKSGQPIRNVQDRVIEGLRKKGYIVHLKKGGLRPVIKRVKKEPATDLQTFIETECKECHETGEFKHNCNECPRLQEHLVQPEKIS